MDFFVDFEKKDGTMLTKLFIGSDAWTKAIEFMDAAKTFGCQSQGPYQTYLESDKQRWGDGNVRQHYPFRYDGGASCLGYSKGCPTACKSICKNASGCFQAQCRHESETIKKGFVGFPNLMKPVKP